MRIFTSLSDEAEERIDEPDDPSNRGRRTEPDIVNSAVFGKSLAEQVEWDQHHQANNLNRVSVGGDINILQVPNIVVSMIISMRANGGEEVEGIFRVSGNHSNVMDLKRRIDLGETGIDFTACDVLDVATLLKEYFRMLPEPVTTFKLYDAFINAALHEDTNQVQAELTQVVAQLPEPNLSVLKYLFAFLNEIHLNCRKNLMEAKQLATSFGFTILRKPGLSNPSDPYAALDEAGKINNVICAFILFYPQIFGPAKRKHRKKDLPPAPTSLSKEESPEEKSQTDGSAHVGPSKPTPIKPPPPRRAQPNTELQHLPSSAPSAAASTSASATTEVDTSATDSTQNLRKQFTVTVAELAAQQERKRSVPPVPERKRTIPTSSAPLPTPSRTNPVPLATSPPRVTVFPSIPRENPPPPPKILDRSNATQISVQAPPRVTQPVSATSSTVNIIVPQPRDQSTGQTAPPTSSGIPGATQIDFIMDSGSASFVSSQPKGRVIVVRPPPPKKPPPPSDPPPDHVLARRSMRATTKKYKTITAGSKEYQLYKELQGQSNADSVDSNPSAGPEQVRVPAVRFADDTSSRSHSNVAQQPAVPAKPPLRSTSTPLSSSSSTTAASTAPVRTNGGSTEQKAKSADIPRSTPQQNQVSSRHQAREAPANLARSAPPSSSDNFNFENIRKMWAQTAEGASRESKSQSAPNSSVGKSSASASRLKRRSSADNLFSASEK